METDGRRAAEKSPAAQESIRNASDLRDQLTRAERAVANLNRAGGEEAANTIRMVDAAEKAIPRLEEQYSIDLKNERGRLQILENRLRNSAGVLVKRAGAKRLQQMRLEVQPGKDEWWWYLDVTLAQQQRQRLRRLGLRIGVGAVVFLVVAVVYQLFLAPSPKSRGADQRLSDAEGYLTQGSLDSALSEYKAVLKTRPDDAEALIAVAAILDQLGRTEEAEPYFAKARAQATSEADYYANLAMVYYRMSSQGAVDATAKAEEAAAKAIAADSGSATAYLALGGVYELQGKVPEAIEALNKAASLTDDAALTASIKMRVGMLSQRPYGLPTTEGETPQTQQ